VNLLKVALSRLIITKNPLASRARDTAHSRPHRTIVENDFDVIAALHKSVRHVLKALRADEIKRDVKVYRGDARNMWRTECESIDSIISSPPYLNAIDYMRGHRLSLVWLGYNLRQLGKIHASSVGTETTGNPRIHDAVCNFIDDLPADLGRRQFGTIKRYATDLCLVTSEAHRVLKHGRTATYVIGNSRICGHEVRNSDLMISAARSSGLHLVDRATREIPENKRYLPLLNSADSKLSNRMRTEHVLVFRKST